MGGMLVGEALDAGHGDYGGGGYGGGYGGDMGGAARSVSLPPITKKFPPMPVFFLLYVPIIASPKCTAAIMTFNILLVSGGFGGGGDAGFVAD